MRKLVAILMELYNHKIPNEINTKCDYNRIRTNFLIYSINKLIILLEFAKLEKTKSHLFQKVKLLILLFRIRPLNNEL